MTMNILVLGGTRFFGRRLIHRLLQEGHDVTVATRGNTQDDFGDHVRRVIADRSDANGLSTKLAGQTYDVVYDQICFTPKQAKASLDALGDRVGRYVFTSTISVYDPSPAMTKESDFDPIGYPVDLQAESYEYGEGKRQAESYLFAHAPCPVVAVRVAMVVSGDDDYTGRFAFHVRHVADGVSIGVLPDDHPITYVTAWDVAAHLHHLGVKSTFAGPINAANGGFFSTRTLCHEIGTILGKTPVFHISQDAQSDPDYSPYAFDGSLYIANELAAADGFIYPPLSDSLPQMVARVVQP